MKIFPLTKPLHSSGGELAERVRAVSLEIYRRAAESMPSRAELFSPTQSLNLASSGDQLIWIDEALTPLDSSRFWPAEKATQPGLAQPIVR